MFINFKFLLIAVLLLNLVVPAFPFQPFGGVLSLDGIDDYAILSFEEHGFLFPKNTREFTVEMWFYPKDGPKHDGRNIIFSQQVYFGLTSHHTNCKVDVSKLCCYGGVYLDGDGGIRAVSGFYIPMERNRWNYIAIIYKDSRPGRAYNNRIRGDNKFGVVNRVSAEVRERPEDFFVGGYAEELVLFPGTLPITRFHGEIDAIRFSKIARYDLPEVVGVEEPFDPPHRFSVDRHTLALWNFDEREGANRFQDEKNEKVLIGMNGASIRRALAVNPASTSLTSTWSEIKSKSF